MSVPASDTGAFVFGVTSTEETSVHPLLPVTVSWKVPVVFTVGVGVPPPVMFPGPDQAGQTSSQNLYL